jgi:gliding motility-associated-like protein
LREAITLANANGTATTDFIHFNIPSTTEAGRTITLQSQLPDLTSNIVIDGTTQPGNPLGFSSAKVTLFIDRFIAYEFTYLFIRNASHVKIYGMCFRYYDSPDAGAGDNRGIGLRNSKHITIGAKNKGNLFTSVRFSLTNIYNAFYTDSTRYVTYQGNVSGVDSRGWSFVRGSVLLQRAADITIGGPAPEEGNIFVGASVSIEQTGITESDFFAKVQHNKFNMNWDGSQLYTEGGQIFLSGNITDDTTTTKTFVLDNIVSSGWPGGISLNQLYHKAVVQGNKLGTDITGVLCRGSHNDIYIANCKKVIVGGYEPGEENIIGFIRMDKRGTHIIRNQFSALIETRGFTKSDDPFCRISTYDNGWIRGTANPHSKVQLYTNTCGGCVRKRYYTTVMADASGNWSFPYTPSMPNLVATATTKDSSTSELTAPEVDAMKYKVVNATCGKSNGYTTGIVIKQGTHIKWLNTRDQSVVSTDTNLVNVPAGYYLLQVFNGENGCPWTMNVRIEDISLPATISPQVINASCGQTNGALSISTGSLFVYKWLNEQYDSIGTGSFINKLMPGTYYLKALVYFDTTCNRTYGPFVVSNVTGPSLQTGSMQTTASTCNNSNGSIKGITAVNVTGSPFLQWVDATNKAVGSGYDLLNVKPGKYRFKFKDASTCDTIISPFYTVTDMGSITIDASAQQVTPSSCAGATGGIKGLRIAYGDTYVWRSTQDGSIAGTSVDVTGLPSGNYQLEVSNSMGCSGQSTVIHIPQAGFDALTVVDATVRDALCEQASGAVKVNTFSKDPSSYIFTWMDDQSGQAIGSGISISQLNGGTYSLMAKDQNSCEKKIYTALVKTIPKPSFDYSSLQVKQDICNAKEGSISSLKVNVLVGPTTYTWYDENNVVAGQSLQLQNAGAGTYTLAIQDGGVCDLRSTAIIIKNTNESLTAPVYDDLVIPRFTDASLKVKKREAGKYVLSAHNSGLPALQQNDPGEFVIPNISTDTSFYIKRVYGTCSSPVTKVQIKVVDQSYFAIANAFTPNHDGKNDRLNLRVVGYIEVKYFKIYNRWGTLVFETNKIGDGWNGSIRNVLQEPGVFVWVAEGTDIKGNKVQGKGSFVLIR